MCKREEGRGGADGLAWLPLFSLPPAFSLSLSLSFSLSLSLSLLLPRGPPDVGAVNPPLWNHDLDWSPTTLQSPWFTRLDLTMTAVAANGSSGGSSGGGGLYAGRLPLACTH